jgi:hypothetical protein
VNNAVERLIDLLPDADWMLAEEIENCLMLHFDKEKQRDSEFCQQDKRASATPQA